MFTPALLPSIPPFLIRPLPPYTPTPFPSYIMYFFFPNPQTSCIMKGISACALHVATSNVIANGECATEQRHQQRSDSPLVKTSSLLFLPTSLFCHFSTLRLMEDIHSVAMEFVFKWIQLSTLYRHPGREC